MTAALTSTGLQIDTTETILTQIQADLRASVSAGLSLSSASVLGQLAGIVADAIALEEQALQVVNGQFDPNSAEGTAADTVCALTGVFRQAATPSTVSLWCVFAAGFVGAGIGTLFVTVAGDSTRVFANAAAIPAGANPGAAFAFQSVATGPVAAPNGTLTALSSPPVGWTSATNAVASGGSGDALLGRVVETDAQMLARRAADLAASGLGTQPAIVRALLNSTDAVTGQPNITYAAVLENETDAVDGNGMQPHTVQYVVEGTITGNPAALGALILSTKAAGIATAGTSMVTVIDANGNPRVLRYTVPAALPIYLTVNLRALAAVYGGGSQATGDAAVAAYLAAWASGGSFGGVTFPAYYQPGTPVVSSRVVAQLFGLNPSTGQALIPGLLDVTALDLGTAYPATSPATFTPTVAQYAELLSGTDGSGHAYITVVSTLV